MAQLLEIMMVLSFGAAWPANIIKSLNAKTTKGKSLPFLLIVEFGYICGIGSKFMSGSVNYVVFFYILNFLMVMVDLLIYVRNYRLDNPTTGGSR
ncbi:MAG: hypothetical protein LBH09_05090 [Peptococcaceae bacterium]|jgi:hypothetical protein|nr:hypothetical protein [Peptococcaceae bacterium]